MASNTFYMRLLAFFFLFWLYGNLFFCNDMKPLNKCLKNSIMGYGALIWSSHYQHAEGREKGQFEGTELH